MKKNIIRLSSKSMQWKQFLVFNFLLVALMANNIVYAQKNNIVFQPDTLKYSRDRFSVRMGGFISGLNSDIQIGSSQLGLGLILDVEDALGLKTSAFVFRSEMEYNFGKKRRHTAKLDYFGLLRSADKVLESDIEIGDIIFPIGTLVNSKYNLHIIKGTYAYSLYQDSRVKLDASFGLFIMPISFSTSALDMSDQTTTFVAPLPVIGLATDFAITPRLFFKQSVELLYLDISNFRGAITDVNIRLEYNLWKHFGFGGGLNSYRVNIQAFGDQNSFFGFKGSLQTGYTGLLLYAKYYFK